MNLGKRSLVIRVARGTHASRIGKLIADIRYGWNNYSFIFYIGGISAILGSLFGIAGWLSTILTVAFFYYIGKFQRAVDRINEERAVRKRERR